MDLKKEDFEKYIWTIGDSIFRYERNFDVKLDGWRFHLSDKPQDIVSELNEQRIILIYNFKNDTKASEAYLKLQELLYKKVLERPVDRGKFLICSH